MDCKAYEADLATLAEGEGTLAAEAHVASCPACARRLEELRRVLSAARVAVFDAPESLVARARGLMRPSPRRVIARLLGHSLAGSGARRSSLEAFSLHVGIEGVSIRLQYVPLRDGWEVLGRVPEEGWTVNEEACGPGGRFRLLVPSLESSGFTVRGSLGEIEIPPAPELLGDGL